ncbi:MAG: phage portal protein [Phycisphaera sp.]|nr:MAG: phage portal protein [Phycisphaera sp.]
MSGLEAGRVSRTDPDFVPHSTGPNRLADESNIELIRARMRMLIDQNELVDGALETHLDNIVGQKGIHDEPDTGWRDLDDQIRDLTDYAYRRVDVERSRTLPEDQELFYRELFGGGESGVHQVMAREFKGYPVMPATELVEADRLDMNLEGKAGNNRVRQSIERDRYGRVVAYHVLRANPNDDPLFFSPATLNSPNVVRVPVDRFELVFFTRRVAQLRGLPRGVSAMRVLRLDENLTQDTMILAQIALAFGALIETPEGWGDDLFQQGTNEQAFAVDSSGNPVDRIEAGGLGFIPPGSKPHFSQPQHGGPNFDSTTGVLQRRASRSLRTSSASLTGDYSKTTFSSARAESLDIRKFYQRMHQVIWCHHTEPYRRRLIDWAVATGRIELKVRQRKAIERNPERLYKCRVIAPGWSYVNPAQESTANQTDVANGVRSRIQIIGEQGGNWRQVVDDEVKFHKYRQERYEEAGLEAPPMGASTAPTETKDDNDDGETPDGARRDTENKTSSLTVGTDAGANGHGGPFNGQVA